MEDEHPPIWRYNIIQCNHGTRHFAFQRLMRIEPCFREVTALVVHVIMSSPTAQMGDAPKYNSIDREKIDRLDHEIFGPNLRPPPKKCHA